MRDLKEHVHYEIQVKPADEVHNSVSLECKVCGKSYLLGWSKQIYLIGHDMLLLA